MNNDCAIIKCDQLYGTGYYQQGNNCVKDMICPSGYTKENNICWKAPITSQCNPGYTFSNGLCWTSGVCPEGYSGNFVGGCRKDPIPCWGDQLRIENTCLDYCYYGGQKYTTRKSDSKCCRTANNTTWAWEPKCNDSTENYDSLTNQCCSKFVNGAYYTSSACDYWGYNEYLGGDGKCYKNYVDGTTVRTWDMCAGKGTFSQNGTPNGTCSMPVTSTNKCDDSKEFYDPGSNRCISKTNTPGDSKTIANPCPFSKYLTKNGMSVGPNFSLVNDFANNVKSFSQVDCNVVSNGYCKLNFQDIGCYTGSNTGFKFCTGGNDQYFQIQVDGNIRWLNNTSQCLAPDLTLKACDSTTLWNITTTLPIKPSKSINDWSYLFNNKTNTNTNNFVYKSNNSVSDPNTSGAFNRVKTEPIKNGVVKLNIENEGCVVNNNGVLGRSFCDTVGSNGHWRYLPNNTIVYSPDGNDTNLSIKVNENGTLILNNDSNNSFNIWTPTTSVYDSNFNKTEGATILGSVTTLQNKFLYDPSSETIFKNKKIVYFNNSNSAFETVDSSVTVPSKFSQDNCDNRAFCKLFTTEGALTKCIGGNDSLKIIENCTNDSKNKWRYQSDKKFHWMFDTSKCIGLDSNGKLIINDC